MPMMKVTEERLMKVARAAVSIMTIDRGLIADPYRSEPGAGLELRPFQ